MTASDSHRDATTDPVGDSLEDPVAPPLGNPCGNPVDDSAVDRRLTSRSVRSFVIRNGRMTDAQADALTRLMPTYGIDFHDRQPSATLAESFSSTSDPTRPLWLEIGIGNGDALLGMAQAHPEVNLIGAEVHAPGIGHALLGIEKLGLNNVRLIRHDAIEVLQQLCTSASLARVMLFFPDPWHKKRHHKRRIVGKDFLDAVAHALAPDGLLHCATDVTDYASWMHDELATDTRFANTAPGREDSPRPEWRPETRFERRGERLGHSVHDLLYRRG